MNRRDFVKLGGAALAAGAIMPGLSWAKGPAGIGMCDWNLGGSADPAVVSKAAKVGLQGIQVSVATNPDNVPLRDPAVRKKYIELGKQYGITYHSVAAGGILNDIPLATEPQSAVYVIDAIEAAAALGAKNILIAFFVNGDLRVRDAEGEFVKYDVNGFTEYKLDEKGVTRVIEVLRQIAPRAEAAGVALGLENTLSARQNLEIINAIGSPMAQVYYDLGNSWGNGYDVPSELRLLGNDRLCEVHLKDWNTNLLGSNNPMVDMSACASALQDIGYDKWLVLETSGRKDKFDEDTRTNIAFAKKTFHMA